MKWAALLALALAALCSPVAAATLYVSEFSNGITPINSSQPQVPPTPSLADQTVALSGSSASSAAFGSATHVVSLICDEGCSVQFGTAPTATTSTLLLQQGVTYLFGVVPGGKVAAIANAAGNSGGGGSVAVTSVIPGVGATNLGKAEDAPAASGDTGVQSLFVRTPATPTAQTSADQDYGAPAVDSFGDVKTLGVDNTGTALTYLASVNGGVPVSQTGYSFTNITTSTTTTVKTGAGMLHIVNVNTQGTVASTVTVYDNTVGSGTKIGTINSLSLSGPFQFDIAFSTGLTLVTTGTAAPDVTVSWR